MAALAAVMFLTMSGDAWAAQDSAPTQPQSESLSSSGLALDVSATRLRVVEGGSAATYTIRPSTVPGRTISITIVNADTTAFTVSPLTLSFNTSNWQTAQQVTITPLQDTDSDHEIVSLTHTASGVADPDIKIYVSDDDATDPPPVPDDAGGRYGTLAQASKALVKVNEGHFEHVDTYTLHLTSDPGQNVTLTVNNPAPHQLTISPTSLTFTAGGSGDWNAPQTVTVTGQSDSDNRNDGLYPLYFIHSSGAFVGPPVLVHTRDISGVGDNTVVYGMEYVYVTERGATATYSVRMAGAPANYLRVNISSTIPKSVLVEPDTVDFDQANWDDPQFITITARDDLDSISQRGMITHRYQEASHTNWDSVTMFRDGKSLPIITTDGWSGDPIFEQNGDAIANALTYDGQEPTYTVRLANDPEQDVTLDLQHDDRFTAHPNQLTFTGGSSGNWASPQTVTLHVGLDSDTDNEEIVIDHVYDGFVEATLPVTIIDSDPKSMIVYVYPSTSTMNEGETIQCYFVALADDPGGEVTMTLTASMPGSLTISPSTLTFNSDNYRDMQPITLTAVEDINANDETVAILHDLPGYRQVTLSIDITDNDPGGITITPRNEFTLPEGPGNYSYRVHLTRDPGVGKTVAVERSGNTDGIIFYTANLYGRLTFTGGPDGTWDIPQRYDFGVDRDSDNVDNTYVATHTTTIDGFTSSSDVILHVVETHPNTRQRARPVVYTGADMIVEIPEPVDCEDDPDHEDCEEPDPNHFPLPTVAPSRLHVVEGSSARSYSVFFTEDPMTDITVTITTESANSTLASWSVTPLTLTFTGGENGNWQTPQWVAVSGVADSDTNDDLLTIVHRATSYAQDSTVARQEYGDSVIANLYDNNTDAVTVSEIALAINEGATATYTVSLASDPGGTATVTPTSSDTSSVTISPALLTFTSSDWMSPQTVTVQAEQDADGDHETATISHAVSGYTTATPPASVSVEVTDDEAPTISITGGSAVTEGAAASFTVSASPAQSTPVSVSITVTQNGEYAAAADIGTKTVSIPTGGTLTYTVDTTADDKDEPDGYITVTLNAGDPYTVSPTQGTAMVVVSDDDDPPECTVQLPSDAITVAEVKVWRDEFTASTHVLRWNKVLAALGESTGESAMTAAESRDIKSRINNSRWDRTTRTLEAMAKCGTTPQVIPELSITAGSDVAEGSDAIFTITATPAPTKTLLVWLSISEVGDFDVDPSGVYSVNMTTSGSYTLELETTGDNVNEADGSAKVAISARPTYTVSTTAGSATVAIADDDVPEISIAAVSDITEGANAMFTLTANPAPATPLTVEVEVTQSADFGAATGMHTVTIPTSGTKTFQVATNDDRADDADGPVTVTISTGTGYTVSAGSGSAEVNVSDNDPPAGTPVISIVAGSDIQEGADATFTVTAIPPPFADLAVSVTISQTGEFVAATGSQTITIPTTGTYAYTVAIDDDDVYEEDGSVTVTVGTNTNNPGSYAASPTDSSATVQVSDDEKANPCVQVVTASGTIEGQWTSSCDSHARWQRYSRFYTFEVSQQSKITIDLVSVADPYLYLRAGQGTDRGASVETNDDGGPGRNARISRQLDVGWYTIEATTYYRRAEDKFQLTIGGLAPGSVQKARKAQVTLPEITIVAGAGVTEGSDATFTVTATPAPSADLDVTVGVSQSGNYVITGSRTVTITTAGSAIFTVPTTNDKADEPDGAVTATISNGTGYTVASNAGAATVAVADNDAATLPEISITAGSGVTEGTAASFTLTASPTPAADLDITIALSQSGDYVTTGSRTVTIPTSGSKTFTVTTTDDSDDEPDGSVTVSINNGSSYTVSSSSSTATVAIADNDTCAPTLPTDAVTIAEITGWRDALDPTRAAAGIKRFNRVLATLGVDTGETPMTVQQAQAVSNWIKNTRWDRIARTLAAIEQSQCDPQPPTEPVITITAGSDITEGTDASFTVTANPTPTTALTVNLTVSQSGNFGATIGADTVTIPTTGSATYTVGTTNDSTDEPDGSVTASLSTGTGYTVSGSNNAATVAVSDDDDPPPAPPTISIAASSGVTEGGSATFTVTASPTPTTALTVNLTVSQNGNFGATTGTDTVIIPTTGSATFTVSTTNDSTDEPDGSVTATLSTGTGYTVSGSNNAATVAVSDDDPPPATPTISIAAGSSITEGTDATFTVTASPAPTSPLTVNLTVSQSGNFGAATGTDTVTIPTTGSATFTVSTTNDSTDEPDGSVTATLSTGTGYTVSSTNNAATVAVSDDDDPPPAPPTISIAAGSGVTEGGSATFTVTATPAPTTALTVNLTVSQSGNFGATTGADTVTIPTSGSTTFTVTTTNDNTDEPHGSVTATLSTGTGYTVSGSSNAATVAVSDNDDPPPVNLPTVSISDAQEYEDYVLMEFYLQLSHASSVPVTVTIEFEEGTATYGGDFLGIDTTQTIAPGQTRKALYVPLRADGWPEVDETFAIKLTSATGATIADDTGNGTILNDD